MSHPNPHDDPENRYPSDDYKPVSKKKSMARKMRNKDVRKIFDKKFNYPMKQIDALIKSLHPKSKR